MLNTSGPLTTSEVSILYEYEKIKLWFNTLLTAKCNRACSAHVRKLFTSTVYRHVVTSVPCKRISGTSHCCLRLPRLCRKVTLHVVEIISVPPSMARERILFLTNNFLNEPPKFKLNKSMLIEIASVEPEKSKRHHCSKMVII